MFVALVILSGCTPFPIVSVDPLPPEAIERLRIMHHNHLPREVLVYRTADNGSFLRELREVWPEINRTFKSKNLPAIQLTVLDTAPAQSRYPDAHITLPHSRDDVWLQDFGEIMAVKTFDQPQERLLLFDTARNRGLDNLAIYLADRWGGAYLDSPQTGNHSGDMGGNIEALPIDLLVIGNTSSAVQRQFLLDKGYRDRHAVLDTSWLQTGHIDEYVSSILTTDDGCGFALVEASPALALDILRRSDPVTIDSLPGNYVTQSKQLLQLHGYLNGQPQARDWFGSRSRRWQRFVEGQHRLQQIIDKNLSDLVDLVGSRSVACKTVRRVALPVLFSCQGRQYQSAGRACRSLLPNPVNMLVLGTHLLMADPHYRPFRDASRQRLNELDQISHFIDSRFYHRDNGGVHCATNVRRDPHRWVVVPKAVVGVQKDGVTINSRTGNDAPIKWRRGRDSNPRWAY